MSLIMEDFKPPVSTLEEVKKLQDLVRKLEIQNLHLRNKQISNRRRSDSPVKERRGSPSSPRLHKRPSSGDKTTYDSPAYVEHSCFSNKDEYFDDLEIIRVSDIEMSDDESWLYISPKSVMHDRRESSYKWLRKDVDDLENKQLQLAKKALLTKLNELEILSPNKMNTHHMENNVVTNLRRSQDFYKTPLSTKNFDNGCIDTRTFTRSKKKQALDFLERLDLINNGRNLERVIPENSNRRESDVSLDSLSICHVLEDANDVQEVARMQEESLRMNSPMSLSKRSSLSSTYRRISSSRGSVSDQDVSEISVYSAHSTGDKELDLYENEFHMDPSQHSNHSSSSESPYGSNISLHNSGKSTAKLSRCSLPNLTRDPVIVRQSKTKVHKESRLLQSSQAKCQSVGRKSDTSLETLHKTHRQDFISPTRQRRSSNQVPQRRQSNFVSSPNSEPTTNVPRSAESAEHRRQPKSGLPRPSRANSASRSIVRSGIPTPSMQNKKRLDDTWSEGCF